MNDKSFPPVRLASADGAPESMELSTIIVNWNTERELHRCLASLPRATEGLVAQTIVVDNASTDGSVAMVRRDFREVEVVRVARNRGFGAGVQEGLSQARGELIAVLNPDLVLAPGSLTGLVRFLRESPRAGWVGPRIWLEDGTLQSEARPLPGMWSALSSFPFLARFRRARERRQPSSITRCGWVRGPCMVFRAQALREIGGFPTETFMYGEELLLGHRLRQAGWEIWYNPRFDAFHVHQASARRRWPDREIVVLIAAGRAVAMRELLGRAGFAIWSLLTVAALALRGVLQSLRIRPFSLPVRPLLRVHLRALRSGRTPSSPPTGERA